VIIDEAHERTIQSDLLLALLKDLITKRKNLNLIIMSATLEIQKIASYFNSQNIIEIKGRTFPIDVFNTETRQNDYIESTLDTIL
jgi:HrpA-like RNA helicase